MRRKFQSPVCARVRHVVARIGDRWTTPALLALHDRPLRFNELLRELEGVSQRMLTFTLRNLEREGLIDRTVSGGAARCYHLTRAGRSLCGILSALRDWGEEHFDALTARVHELPG